MGRRSYEAPSNLKSVHVSHMWRMIITRSVTVDTDDESQRGNIARIANLQQDGGCSFIVNRRRHHDARVTPIAADHHCGASSRHTIAMP